MEIRQLEYFVAVSDMGSFTKAAEVCHVVQTTVSHSIAALERELGVTLFVRDARSVSLTSEGGAFLGDARAIIDRVRRSERELRRRQSQRRGTLVLGYYGAGFGRDFPEIIRRYRAETGLDVAMRGFDANESGADPALEVRGGSMDAFVIAHAPIGEHDCWARQRVVAYNRMYLATAVDDELACGETSIARERLAPIASSICMFRASRAREYVAAMREWLAVDFGIDSAAISWNDSMEDARLLARCGQCRLLTFLNSEQKHFREDDLAYSRVDGVRYLPLTLVWRAAGNGGGGGLDSPGDRAGRSLGSSAVSPVEMFAEIARRVSCERGIDVSSVGGG